jgi:hypothetical protein
MKTLGVQAVRETAFTKTPAGQLLYDLAFVTRSDKWLARKHRVPVAEIRELRELKAVKKLAAKNAKRKAKK